MPNSQKNKTDSILLWFSGELIPQFSGLSKQRIDNVIINIYNQYRKVKLIPKGTLHEIN